MGIFFTNLLTMKRCAEKKNDGYFVKEDEQLASLIYVEVGQELEYYNLASNFDCIIMSIAVVNKLPW